MKTLRRFEETRQYQDLLVHKEMRFCELLKKSESTYLSESEENEILKLNADLEGVVDHIPLSEEELSRFAYGKLDDLIQSTKEILERLKNDNQN